MKLPGVLVKVALSLEGLKDLKKSIDPTTAPDGNKAASAPTEPQAPEQHGKPWHHGIPFSWALELTRPDRTSCQTWNQHPSPHPRPKNPIPPGSAFSQTEMFAMVLRTSFVSTVAMQFIGAEMADFWTTKIHGNPLSSTSARALVALPASGFIDKSNASLD